MSLQTGKNNLIRCFAWIDENWNHYYDLHDGEKVFKEILADIAICNFQINSRQERIIEKYIENHGKKK